MWCSICLIKALNLTYTDNIVERAGGLHIYSEQEWLEGDLGIANVVVRNTTVVDPTPCGASTPSQQPWRVHWWPAPLNE